MRASRKRGWLGVDIGSRSVKIAQLERRGDRCALIEAAVIPRRQLALETAGETPATSSGEIRAALSVGDQFRGRRAATAAPMALCQLRRLEISPGTRAHRIAEITQRLAANPTGMDTTGREFDFWSVAAGATQPGAHVNLLSIPTETSDRLALDQARAGLDCRTMDGIPFALARAVELAGFSGNEPVAIADWGASGVLLCIVRQRIPHVVRYFPSAGLASFLRGLMHDLELTWSEAHRLLSEYGLPGSDTRSSTVEVQRAIETYLRPAIDSVVEEFQRTDRYLRGYHPDLLPRCLVLTGGGAAIRHLAAHLSLRIGISVQPWKFLGDHQRLDPTVPIAVLAQAISLSALAWSRK